MPPEGIALSTELQTHSGLFRKKQCFFLNSLNYPSTKHLKSKVFYIFFFLLPLPVRHTAIYAGSTSAAAHSAAVSAVFPLLSPVAADASGFFRIVTVCPLSPGSAWV